MPGRSTETSKALSVLTMFASGRNLSLCPNVAASGPKNSAIHFGNSVSKSVSRGNRVPHGVKVRAITLAPFFVLLPSPNRCATRRGLDVRPPKLPPPRQPSQNVWQQSSYQRQKSEWSAKFAETRRGARRHGEAGPACNRRGIEPTGCLYARRIKKSYEHCFAARCFMAKIYVPLTADTAMHVMHEYAYQPESTLASPELPFIEWPLV